MPRFAVILPAAGASTRFGPRSNQLSAALRDSDPVIAVTLEAFLRRDDVELIVIATPPGVAWPPEKHDALEGVLSQRRVRRCEGGPSRAHSVRNALALVPKDVEWVAVHDAARPLVSAALVDRTLGAAATYGAAVPA